jgi:SP family arabinose:H+ symporter-like MFS transporter
MQNTAINPVMEGKRRIFYPFFISFAAAIGGFLFGYDLNIMSGGNALIRDQFNLNGFWFGIATASATIGCIAGPLWGFKLCDKIGRKNTLILAAILFAVSAIVTALAPDMITYNIFRAVGGLGIGLSSMASPMYIAEVSPARIRGRLGLMYQIAIVVGSTIASFVAWQLAIHLDETVSWRWMLASENVAIIVFGACLVFIPESPRWLAEKGRFEEAKKILSRIDGPEFAEKEVQEISLQLNQETGSWSEVFSSYMRIALMIGILLAIFNNLTGWTAMSYYFPVLLQENGLEGLADCIGWYVLVNVWQIVVTVAAIFLVDRAGRRPLWIFGSAFMIGAMLLNATIFFRNFGVPVTVVMTCVTVLPHAFALGSIPWFMMSELYPTKIRAKAVAFTTTIVWTAGFIATMTMPILMDWSKNLIGSVALVFVLFAGMSLLALLFGIKIMPETKGRTLEEIGQSWRRGKKPAN